MARQVIVDDRFNRYTDNARKAVEKSLIEAAEATAEAARGAASPSGYNTGGIQAKTFAELSTYPTSRGPAVNVVNRDFRGLWFEKGTYRSHKGKLSDRTVRRRQSAGGQARLAVWGDNWGVKPQHFMRRALTYGQKVLMERIKANLP